MRLLILLQLLVLTAGGTPSTPEKIPLGLDPRLPWPKEAHAPQEIELGRRLFSDTLLSKNKDLACSSCHSPEASFSDSRPVSPGTEGRLGRRNAPSLLNVAYRRPLFWDGRSETLEEQALHPLSNPLEMSNSFEQIEERLAQSPVYSPLFQQIFGEDRVTVEMLARVLAAYQRTLLSGDSDFDRFFWTGDRNALSPAARRGMELFFGKARCSVCHNGFLLSDGRFHNTGVSWGKSPLDLGRYEVTGRVEDRGRFLIPSLRNVARTAPYMHDGSLETLREVVDFYDGGGGKNPHLDPNVKPLGLSQKDKSHLVQFLKALNGRE